MTNRFVKRFNKVYLVKGDERMGPYVQNGKAVRIGEDVTWVSALKALGYTIEPYEEPRREFWVARNYQPSGCKPIAYFSQEEAARYLDIWPKDRCDGTHVVELRKGEVIIDRDKLAEAWDSLSWGIHTLKSLCKALGLEGEG